jgi:hypothetical protein
VPAVLHRVAFIALFSALSLPERYGREYLEYREAQLAAG